MAIKTKIIKTVIVMGVISIIFSFFGCSGERNETVSLDGNKFIVLNVGNATPYKTKKGNDEALFVFTAPETGVYTVWNESDEYAFCRIYNASTLDWSIYSDCQIEPFIKSFPLNAGESAYIGSINFSADTGYEGIITVNYRDNAPEAYENYGYPLEIKPGDIIPFDYKYSYTDVVYEFNVPQDGIYLFYTSGDENAMPYLNIYTEPWCRPQNLIENIDHIEIPTENYYTIENCNFSKALKLNKGDVIYLALAVRTANTSGNFYLKLIEE